MRLSRKEFVPLLAIIAGGAIGVFALGSFVLLLRSDEVPAPERPVRVRTVPARPAPDGQPRVFDECADDRVYRLLESVDEDRDPVQISPDAQSTIVVQCPDGRVDGDEEADLSAAPVFTPMTLRPEIRNRSEVQAALVREYPALLRDAGIGGRVLVWFFISEDGVVLDTRVSESSGHLPLDEAALQVADVFRFSPALNREQIVQVWIQLPITFQVQN